MKATGTSALRSSTLSPSGLTQRAQRHGEHRECGQDEIQHTIAVRDYTEAKRHGEHRQYQQDEMPPPMLSTRL